MLNVTFVNIDKGLVKNFYTLADIFILAQSWDYKKKEERQECDILNGKGFISINGKKIADTNGSEEWDPDGGEYYSLSVKDVEVEGYQSRFHWFFGPDSCGMCHYKKESAIDLAESIIWDLFQERKPVRK